MTRMTGFAVGCLWHGQSRRRGLGRWVVGWKGWTCWGNRGIGTSSHRIDSLAVTLGPGEHQLRRYDFSVTLNVQLAERVSTYESPSSSICCSRASTPSLMESRDLEMCPSCELGSRLRDMALWRSSSDNLM